MTAWYDSFFVCKDTKLFAKIQNSLRKLQTPRDKSVEYTRKFKYFNAKTRNRKQINVNSEWSIMIFCLTLQRFLKEDRHI